MLLLCASWALQQVAVKLTLPEIPPLIQATLRSTGGLLVVVLIARLRGQRLFTRDGTLAAGLCIGVIFGIEFILIFQAVTLTTASRAIVFIYVAPFLVALGARPFLGERLTVRQWSGLALSFSGVAVALGVPQSSVDGRMLTGDLMSVGGGIAWAAVTLIAKASRLNTVPAEKTLAYQLAVSIPCIGIASWLLGERLNTMPGPFSIGLMTFQSVWVVGFTFLAWYMLMKSYSASKLSAFTFLTPLLGVAGGVVILKEDISPAFALAALLVIAGLVLVNRPARTTRTT